MWPTIQWDEDKVIMIDQRKLPAEEVRVQCRDVDQVAEAIETMVIRGAPAIGVAAAFGVALGLRATAEDQNLEEEFNRIVGRLKRTRPTAKNLFWALERMNNVFARHKRKPLVELREIMLQEALAVEREDLETCRRIGRHGSRLLSDGQTVLTHCNAGALATAGYGTALGVIRAACESGKNIRVYADETRPFLQGARLTCWELDRDGIPVVLITDNMAGYLMRQGEISLVVTGADRIARNGDTANKIGTYAVAVLAKENGIPFFIAAPMSTIDFDIASGAEIPIEERDPREVREIEGICITVPGIPVRNPAFDVTPARYISAIITERGIARPPFGMSLDALNRK